MALHIEPTDITLKIFGRPCKVWVVYKTKWYSTKIQHMHIVFEGDTSNPDVRCVDPGDPDNGYLMSKPFRDKIWKLYTERKYGWKDTMPLPSAKLLNSQKVEVNSIG